MRWVSWRLCAVIVFAVINKLVGPTQGLFAALIVSVALLMRDWVTPGWTPKILEIGTPLMLGNLALYAVLAEPTGPSSAFRGLFLIVLISMAVGRPFTYAREQFAPEFRSSPEFVTPTTSSRPFGRSHSL